MDVTSESEPRGWQASLGLRFAARDGRTVVAERTHRGPLQVQRAFYPEGPELCHCYLLHPPGGLVGGDELAVQVAVDGGAHALVTTPAAGKIYRSAGAIASVRQRLAVAAGGSLEWFPQETIVFDGAQVELETRVDLDEGAAFIGWEILCLGRPAAGERFLRGFCRQRVELWRAGEPLVVERAHVAGGGAVLAARWGLADAPVTATLLATPAPAELEGLRALSALVPADLTSVTRLGDVLLCRYLGASAERARAHFGRVWAAVRPGLLGRADVPPRIWVT